jgi:multidrug efflux system membrane fusion protein
MLTVAVRPRIDSQIQTVHVVEGARVEAGDLLFTLDARTLNAALAQLEAQLAKDRAQLEQAHRDVARYQDLAERNATTRVNLENAQTNTKVLTAQVAATEASIANVQTQLSFTEIRAPASGRVGAIQAKIGSIVRQNDTQPLVVINQVDPIYVQFALPQNLLVELRRAMAAGRVPVVAMAGDMELQGEVAFIENAVDAATGTISVKARIPNPDELIWPGAFSRARVTLGIERNAVVVPSSAIQMGLKGAYVFVVKDNKAELRQVDVKRTSGAQSVIAAGVKAGEQVVVDGQLRLVNGAPVSAKSKSPAIAAQPARS